MCAGTHERKKSGIEVPEEGIAGFELTKVSARIKLRFSTRTTQLLMAEPSLQPLLLCFLVCENVSEWYSRRIWCFS